MQTATVTIDQIRSKLVKVPSNRLPEIYNFVEFILQGAQPKKRKVAKLGGIWKGLGFEKIENLDAEIRSIREKSHQEFSKKSDRWNT